VRYPHRLNEGLATMVSTATADDPECRSPLGAVQEYRHPVSCALHRGPRGFANLVARKHNSEIVVAPHVTGAFMIIFNQGRTELDVVGRRRLIG
jgi:hypothetical protein